MLHLDLAYQILQNFTHKTTNKQKVQVWPSKGHFSKERFKAILAPALEPLKAINHEVFQLENVTVFDQIEVKRDSAVFTLL